MAGVRAERVRLQSPEIEKTRIRSANGDQPYIDIIQRAVSFATGQQEFGYRLVISSE